MPDMRINKSIATRLDIERHRRPDPLMRRRRAVIWASALLAVGAIALAAMRGDQTIYQARPVTMAHQLFQHDCQVCHAKAFQTVSMKFGDPGFIHDVEQQTCLKCHAQSSLDHHGNVHADHLSSCFDCHKEHRGHADLSRVADGFCINCHRDLHRVTQGTVSFETALDAFAAHPEIAVRRDSDENVGPAHGALERAAFLAGEDDKGHWVDRASLRFNHELHLAEMGVPVPATHPEFKDRSTRKVLGCNDCHQREPGGSGMLPINYQKHCASCHTLDFNEELHLVDADLDIDPALPHVEPKLLRGVLRDRLMAYIKQHPEKLRGEGTEGDEQAAQSRLPHKREPLEVHIEEGVSRDQWEWVERRIADTESRLLASVKHGCAHCHTVETPPGAPDPDQPPRLLDWKIKPTNIPSRWLPHAEFRHDRHDVMRCTDCHYQHMPSGGIQAAEDRGPHSVYASKHTRDVLMPSLETCRNCHGSSKTGQGSARSDCVECHKYHHTLPEPVGRPLGELLSPRN